MIGIDEVGRGCWAGPLLVVAARATGTLPTGLADSKKLSKKRRSNLFHDISLTCDIGEGWVEPHEIDRYGLSAAMHLGVQRALSALPPTTEAAVLLDGNINYADSRYCKFCAWQLDGICKPTSWHVSTLIDADATAPIVSAASIYAKVLRDIYMAQLSEHYPEYEFEKHVGYGTELHRRLLQKHGVSDQHRLSYKPVQAFLEQP